MKLNIKKVMVLLTIFFILFFSLSIVSALEDTNTSLSSDCNDSFIENDSPNLQVEDNEVLNDSNENTTLSEDNTFSSSNLENSNQTTNIIESSNSSILKGQVNVIINLFYVLNGELHLVKPNMVIHKEFGTKFKIVLSSVGIPLIYTGVTLNINNNYWIATTDKSGGVFFNIPNKVGRYKIGCFYPGSAGFYQNYKSVDVMVKPALKSYIKVADSYINYRQGLKSPFIVKLVDSNNKAIVNKVVKFTVDGKSYSAKTDSKGFAVIKINLKKGVRTIKFSFSKSYPYLASSGLIKIKVKSPMAKGYAYWVNGKHMKKVKLSKLKACGTKHIFLLANAFSIHGKTAVKSWVKKSNKYGIKVHIWMQVFYSGGKWVHSVDSNGKFKHSFFNKKIKQAKYYARIKGVSGVHLDYLRYPGSAYKHDNSARSITYFTKKCCAEVHKVKPNAIVSAAVMPEPSAMIHYYGQDIPQLSKYLDVVVPMAYKGNYHAKTPWIKSVTSSFVKQSNGAQIWTGLQTYKSDSNTKMLSYSELFKDAKAGMNGGAKGIALFRYGLTKFLNFKKL